MNLRLVREASRFSATIGRLEVEGAAGWAFECWILEDQVREQAGVDVASWKVKGQTAIPAGLYQVVITMSARFGRRLPLLLGVPGFEGIRIHPGNDHGDTEGCLLPGRTRGVATVAESRAAFNALMVKLVTAIAAGEEVWIHVENPRAELQA